MDAHNKQKHFCVSLLRYKNRNYFENIGTKIIKDSRQIWKIVNPLFSDNCFSIINYSYSKEQDNNRLHITGGDF